MRCWVLSAPRTPDVPNLRWPHPDTKKASKPKLRGSFEEKSFDDRVSDGGGRTGQRSRGQEASSEMALERLPRQGIEGWLT